MPRHTRIRKRHRSGLLALAAQAAVTGSSEKALRLFRTLLEANPEDAEARYGLALCLIDLGQPDEGIAELEQVVSSAPDAVYDLGVAYELKGDQARADDCYRRALAANPDDADACERLAARLEAKGDTAGAAALRRYQPAGLEDEERKRLARLYRRRGSYLHGFVTMALSTAVIGALLLREVHRTARVGQPVWEAMEPFQRFLLVALFAATAIIFLLWSYERARIRRRLASDAASGVSAARIDAVVQNEVERQEEEELEQRVEAQEELAEERRRGPSWWRVELSGAHLVWWVALSVALLSEVNMPVVPAQWGPVVLPVAWAVAVPGLLMKWAFWGLYNATTDEARIGRLRFYRWWGRGPLPVAIALLPGLLALLVIHR